MTATPGYQDQAAYPGAPQGAEQATPIDYFDFQATERVYLNPADTSQWFELQIMNEGLKLKFQRNTSKDLIMDRRTGDARMKMESGAERHALIKTCVVNWSLYRAGQPIPYSTRNLEDFLTLANPAVVERIETRIRELNPWLLGDMTVQQIDEEIERLTDLRADVEKRESGKDSSSVK